jgi:hypothetical protein
MKNTALILTTSFLALFNSVFVYAYPITISRFEDEGVLYIESSSIKKKKRFVSLTYVEDFKQPRNFGEHSYLSKATDIRIDCQNRRVFAINQYYYSGQDRGGRLLGTYSLNDQFGSYAEHGSWVSQVVNIGCAPR